MDESVKTVFFGTWNQDDPDPNAHFWEIHYSIEDAVSSQGGVADVFRITAKPIGRWKRKVNVVKIKKRKARRK